MRCNSFSSQGLYILLSFASLLVLYRQERHRCVLFPDFSDFLFVVFTFLTDDRVLLYDLVLFTPFFSYLKLVFLVLLRLYLFFVRLLFVAPVACGLVPMFAYHSLAG